MNRVTINFKLFVFMVVLFSLNFCLANCDYLNKKSKQFSPGLGKPLMEKSGDYDVFDSSELESSEMKEIEYINKLRLLEYFLSQLSLNHDLSRPVFKRGFSRSLGKDDRRRPGWELAYGKKKRSIN